MGPLAFLTERPVAHRGLHDAARGIIENTPSAVRAALAGGYGIEVDLQMSADGMPVVFHDETLDRLAHASGKLAARTARELAMLPLRGTADRIMSLPDLLAQVAGRAPLLIELKSAFDGDVRLAARACEMLVGYHGPAALMSFDPDLLRAVRALQPERARGLVAQRCYAAHDWPQVGAARRLDLALKLHAPRSRFQFLAYRVQDLAGPLPRLARGLGMPVLTWTVRDEAARARARQLADQIIFERLVPVP